MKRMLSIILLLAVCAGAAGQEADSKDPAAEKIHDQLSALREKMFAAYKKRDVDALLKDVEKNVVVTWQNGERNLNHDEFLAFYNKMLNGDNRIVEDVTSEFEVKDLSLIYGDDTAVAYGTCTDYFTLSDGSKLNLNSKWTATVVKKEDDWKVASFHISASIFDNPILDAATSWLMKAGIIGGVIGAVIGLIVGYLIASMKRKKSTAATT